MASPQGRNDENPKINRERLRENGIDYFHTWENMGPPPSHINKLREALTDTSCSLSSRLTHDSSGGLVIKPNLLTLPDLSRDHIYERLAQYRSIAENAKHLQDNLANESDWKEFYKINFLEPLFCKYQLKELDSRPTSQTKFYYDFFERPEDLQWSLFSREGPYYERRRNLTYPKPDWSAYFPICNLEHPTAPGFTRKPLWIWPSKNGKMVHGFDAKKLQEFSNHGLQCHVAGALHGKKNVTGLDPDKMQSFPWFIVEFKKTKGNATLCYCQAANGAACGLLMYETLSQHAAKEVEEAQIPPIITMTTVGQFVKLWIGYAGPNEEPKATRRPDKYRNWFHSRCFWEGDMTKVTDAMDLEVLLENIHTWAVRVLRPHIIQCLREWRLRIERHDHDQSSKPRSAKRADDASQDVRLRIEEMDARLRTTMVAFQDDTVDMMEKLLSNFTADLRLQIQEEVRTRTDTRPRMDAGTQTDPSPIYAATHIEKASQTNGPSLNTSQPVGAPTSKNRDRETGVDGNLNPSQMMLEMKAGATELDHKSDGRVPKSPARMPQQLRSLLEKEPNVLNDKTFHSPSFSSSGAGTPPLCFTGSTSQRKDALRPKLQHSARAVTDSKSPPSLLVPERLVGSDNQSSRALSTGDLHETYTPQHSVRPEAQISTATTPSKAAFRLGDHNNAQFEFTFKI